MRLRRLLARVDRRKSRAGWTVRCRDERGARTEIQVRLGDEGLVITSESAGPWSLTPLEAGRLRGAVREALLTLDRDGAEEPAREAAPQWSRPVVRPIST